MRVMVVLLQRPSLWALIQSVASTTRSGSGRALSSASSGVAIG
jgi:hypothetical protein